MVFRQREARNVVFERVATADRRPIRDVESTPFMLDMALDTRLSTKRTVQPTFVLNRAVTGQALPIGHPFT